MSNDKRVTLQGLKEEIERQEAEAEFLSAGWKYLTAISGEGVCTDRSCLRCRIADALAEIESPRALPLTVPACPMCGHKGGKLIDNVGVPTEVCEVATCDCECEFSAQGDTVPAEDSEI